MYNIWSDNKYVNITINLLLFLLGINFMHYGQFTLPIICLILFIDRKFKFHVNNIKTFIILCLFAISFFVFSYKQGFYSVMGFCLPMAYYIGSNINETNENNIKIIIYIIIFGMLCHVLLNFLYDIYINNFHLFYSTSHYDIWLLDKVSPTSTSVLYTFVFGCLYYIVNYEKNKKQRILLIILFVLAFIYCFGLGERTLVLMLIISYVSSLILDICLNRNNKNIKKRALFIIMIFCILCLLIFAILFILNNKKYESGLNNIRIIYKFILKGISSERINILINTVKQAPYYLFGGNEISNVLGIMPHDLWSDVYDCGGIITFILLITHTIMFVITFINILKNTNITKEFKILIIPLFICITLQMMLEPIMSGASLFLICVILLEALLEKLNNYEI